MKLRELPANSTAVSGLLINGNRGKRTASTIRMRSLRRLRCFNSSNCSESQVSEKLFLMLTAFVVIYWTPFSSLMTET
jgi:hypothetical protein